MVLEATMICIDNSEWMRNGDYAPSRFQAQADAVNLICGAKTQRCCRIHALVRPRPQPPAAVAAAAVRAPSTTAQQHGRSALPLDPSAHTTPRAVGPRQLTRQRPAPGIPLAAAAVAAEPQHPSSPSTPLSAPASGGPSVRPSPSAPLSAAASSGPGVRPSHSAHPSQLRLSNSKMTTKLDQSSAEHRRAKSTAASSLTPKISIFGAKAGFVIPKNKLAGSLVIRSTSAKTETPAVSSEDSSKHVQRKTKWAPDLALDPIVCKGRALAYQGKYSV